MFEHMPTTNMAPSISIDDAWSCAEEDYLVAYEGHSKRTPDLNRGRIARASSFASMEDIARSPGCKGIIWQRSAHSQQAEMGRWADAQKETRSGCFSIEQLLTSGATRGAGVQPSKRAKLLKMSSHNDDVQVACERVVAGLPAALRGPMSRDARELAELLLRLCPDAPWLTIQVEVISERNSCTRWHQDSYTARAIITYTGPGTWCVDDASVRYDQFAQTLGMPFEQSDPRIVPNASSIHRPQSNAVILLKGNDWPGIQGVGVTHKAPNAYSEEGGKRLLLKVDLSAVRPDIEAE